MSRNDILKKILLTHQNMATLVFIRVSTVDDCHVTNSVAIVTRQNFPHLQMRISIIMNHVKFTDGTVILGKSHLLLGGGGGRLHFRVVGKNFDDPLPQSRWKNILNPPPRYITKMFVTPPQPSPQNTIVVFLAALNYNERS